MVIHALCLNYSLEKMKWIPRLILWSCRQWLFMCSKTETSASRSCYKVYFSTKPVYLMISAWICLRDAGYKDPLTNCGKSAYANTDWKASYRYISLKPRVLVCLQFKVFAQSRLFIHASELPFLFLEFMNRLLLTGEASIYTARA